MLVLLQGACVHERRLRTADRASTRSDGVWASRRLGGPTAA